MKKGTRVIENETGRKGTVVKVDRGMCAGDVWVAFDGDKSGMFASKGMELCNPDGLSKVK